MTYHSCLLGSPNIIPKEKKNKKKATQRHFEVNLLSSMPMHARASTPIYAISCACPMSIAWSLEVNPRGSRILLSSSRASKKSQRRC